jgi:galactonate dehydratase
MPRLEAVREEVGDEVDILLECHGKFDPPTAIWLADQCRHLDLFLIEEPVHSHNPALHREVRDSTNIPLATGERLIGRDGCRPFIETQAVAILQPDLGMAGGPVEVRKIADHAEQYDIFMAPHNAGSPVCTAASLHFDLASPNFLIQETFPYRPEDFYAFVTEPFEKKIEGGYLAKPETPGLGLEVNADFVKSQCIVLEVN